VRRSAPLLRDLSLASRAAFEDLASHPGADFGLVKKGLLMLCRSAHSLDEEAKTAAAARALGLPAEVLDARQTAALDPGVTMDIQGAVYFPRDCHLSPDRLMAYWQRELEASSTRFQWGTEVTGWRKEGREIKAVQTDHGEVAADEFVLCGGSWSEGMVQNLGLQIPLQAGKGYSLTLPQPRQLPRLCAIFTEARVAVTPMGERLRFGGTMEIAGLNEQINPLRVRGIIKAIPKYYPQVQEGDFAEIAPWRGLRPCSPDGLPYLGRTQRCSNLCVATGHAMMGLSLAPVSGQIIAALVSNERPTLTGAPGLAPDLSLLSPDRYG
jgi:D-amino-acid dehydrogenase